MVHSTVRSLIGERVLDIALGERHVVAITEPKVEQTGTDAPLASERAVYAWGDGSYGKLGTY